VFFDGKRVNERPPHERNTGMVFQNYALWPHMTVAQNVAFGLTVPGRNPPEQERRVGEPGGPIRYALRRLPIRRDMYRPEHLRHMSDSQVMPYEQSDRFTYHPEWTGSLFSVIRVLIRAMCLDTHDELTAAWEAIHRAGGLDVCPEAMAALTALPPGADYTGAKGPTSRRITGIQLHHAGSFGFPDAGSEADVLPHYQGPV